MTFRIRKIPALFICLSFLAVIFITAPVISADKVVDARVAKSYGKLPLSFVENKGQMDKRARFVISGPRASAFFRNDGVTFDLWEASKKDHLNKHDMLDKANLEKLTKSEKRKHAVLKLTFKGADPKCQVKGMDSLPGKVNYMIGNNKKKWHTDVPTYKGVIYKNVWKGIDVMYRGDRQQLKYDIRVNPGADIGKVRLQYDGAQRIWLDKKGDLHIKTAVTEFIEKVPGIYQEKSGKKINVSGGYRLLNANTVGFSVKDVDSSLPLVIDPASSLVYSTLLGRYGISVGYGIAIDSSNCIYVTGITYSSIFPTTAGAFDESYGRSDGEAFITKLNSSGNELVYSTFIGGSNYDQAIGIAVDSTDCAYITGYNSSSDFPFTEGSYDESNNKKIFVAKLNSAGNRLVYSTAFGGFGTTRVYAIAIDTSGCAYVTGNIDYRSWDYPTTEGAFCKSLGDDYSDHIFVTKINSTGSGLDYSTFLRGSSYDYAYGIAVDSTGCAYVTGCTESSDFPTTQGAFDESHVLSGFDIGFITKLNPTGSGLIYSTYLGGGYDVINGIAIDQSGCAFVTGYTFAPDFPTTQGAFNVSFNHSVLPQNDAFVTKLNSTGSGLIYSTFLSGLMDDVGQSIAVDSSGCAYITGYTGSSDYPVTQDAFDKSYNGDGCDVIMTKLNPAGSGLIYSTYIGGEKHYNDIGMDATGDDIGYGIVFDQSGNAYVTGAESSYNFPSSHETFGDSFNGYHVFAVKFDSRLHNTDLLIKTGLETAYSGIGIFDEDGTNQTKFQDAIPGQKVTYAYKIKNSGFYNNSFAITGPGGGNGWSIKYYDLTTGADITSQVTGTGWSSGILAPGANKGLFTTVKPDATVPAGSVNTLLIKAESEADDSKIDVVKAVTTFTANYKTDMLIKNGTDGSYSGTGIYSADGSGQTKSQNVSPNQKVTCAFRARNAGTANDSFRITGPAGGSGWSVKYYDLTTNADVTSQVTGSGWVSGVLAPGVSSGVYANIKPSTSVSLGSSMTLTVTGTSIADNSKIDVVKAVTTCVASYKPDLLIKAGTESSYTGTDIINLDGTDQTKSQNASAGQKVVYSFRVLNAGYLSDSIKITGPAGGSGWSVKYYDLTTNADVTSQVTGAGWISGILAPGGAGGVYAKVSPDATVKSGTANTLLITAVSVGDGSKQDVVKAVTTVP